MGFFLFEKELLKVDAESSFIEKSLRWMKRFFLDVKCFERNSKSEELL